MYKNMDSSQPSFPYMQEKDFVDNLFSNYARLYVLCILICLLISYYAYSKVLATFLEKTKIPKLYQLTTLHSLWMGIINLLTAVLCFTQLRSNLQSPSLTDLHQPSFLADMLNVATANFCQYTTDYNNSSLSTVSLEETHIWTQYNSVSLYIACAVLIQEILLATRNKMDKVFYSRLFGLIFVISAVKTRCPILSIQGTYLMSINASSKEIACALVACKSYSQEDSDHRPPPLIKFVTFLFFVIHSVIWFSLIFFYLPFFIHKLPSIAKDDINRLFLAYSYLSILAYTVLEAATSPLWTTIRCLGWCRRSSGMTWRILALSDCHLLGHFSPVVLELHRIQMDLDLRKALFRNKMIQKHWALVEERRRKSEIRSETRRSPSLLAELKTVVALKRKMRRRFVKNESEFCRSAGVSDEDLNITDDVTGEDKEIVAVMQSKLDSDIVSTPLINEGPDSTDKAEEEKDTEESIERNIIEATVSKEDVT